MTPLQAYYQKIQEKTLQPDPDQEMAMQCLQEVYVSLLATKKWPLYPFYLKMRNCIFKCLPSAMGIGKGRIAISPLERRCTVSSCTSGIKKKKSGEGLYLWGEVGRGKTQLMDLFYNHLPVPKLRMHFYQFMQEIHHKLTQLQGQANPLNQIAKDLAHTTKIICLDEFLVHEIADAMLLAQLIRALFLQGIILVTTANTPPDNLYQNGLQRELFLPAITQIKQQLTTFHLDSPFDYRLHHDPKKDTSFDWPVTTMTSQQMQQLFDSLCKEKTISYQPLAIHGRLISHKGHTDNTIWFDFTSICAIPRSQLDYLAIAKLFSTVLISELKPIREQDDNRARLFIHLIDIFYDANSKMLLSSETKHTDLYPKGRFLFEFKRAKSRLNAFQKKFQSLLCLKK